MRDKDSEQISFSVNKKALTLICGGVVLLSCVVGVMRFYKSLSNGGENAAVGTAESCPLIAAIKNRNIPEIKKLITQGVYVNDSDADGNTPLILAIQYNLQDIPRRLIEAGADVNICNKKGCSPLMMAAECGSQDTVIRLIEKGGRINDVN